MKRPHDVNQATGMLDGLRFGCDGCMDSKGLCGHAWGDVVERSGLGGWGRVVP